MGDYSERELRKVILHASCESRNQECLDMAANLFKQWTKGAQLSPDTKQVVYCYGLKVFNSEQLWPLMWGKYLEERDPREKLILLNALTTVRNTTLLERTYGRDETEEMAAKVFQGFNTQKDLQKETRMTKRIIQQKEIQMICINILFVYLADLNRYFVFLIGSDFYQRHRSSTRHGAKAHAQALYSISRNIHWLRRHRQSVRDWLLTHVYMPWRNIRLPRHILPTHYDLLLRPNVTTETFEGEEQVRLNITESTDYILLHESGLKILSTRLLGEDRAKEVVIGEEFSYKRNEYHVIVLKEDLLPGTYHLNLKFSGKFSSTGRGNGSKTSISIERQEIR
ncbi:glutamyl aminopeptidase [Trichonephila inaurata madagascariensis]|uniref:Glutamyl aminopeptidase n=1 Tax=Trichonephila inaurata madagascariensis TaxID=2747483 RepID=A0A8X6Y2V3_9ARAC|nr:glutamyl aminopeptidase [Trichonephila inaurata madagascariensis]